MATTGVSFGTTVTGASGDFTFVNLPAGDYLLTRTNPLGYVSTGVQPGVGGTSDGRIGTSPDQIRASFDQIATADGVLVMTDLGSAVISAECALEGVGYPYWLSNAPLVEGAVLAAVEASLASTLQEVASAAERAWAVEKTPGRSAVMDRRDQRTPESGR